MFCYDTDSLLTHVPPTCHNHNNSMPIASLPSQTMALLFALLCFITRKANAFATSRPLKSAETHRLQSSFLGVAQTPSLLLDDVLRGNSTAASEAVGMLTEVRGTETMEEYLSDMTPPEMNDFPLWARLPGMAKVSRRARQLRLRRLLEISTPTAEDESEDSEESKNKRTRRALFVLIRNIADSDNYSCISEVLSIAKRDAADENVSSEEMMKRTPDLETPKYEVVGSRKGGFEIRRYEQFSVCSVTMNELKSSGSDRVSASKISNPQLSGASSFGALAGYLFGKNQDEKAMKMTTPVLTVGEGDEKTMSFVLPSDYWKTDTLSDAPQPLADSAVKISSVDGSTRAVIAFGGYGGKAQTKSKRLTELLESDKEWRAVADAPVTLAQYNDPFTPPWKRRNEVSVLVEPMR